MRTSSHTTTIRFGGWPTKADRCVATPLESSAGLIDAFPDVEIEICETYLACGDILALVTDGVTEARGETAMFGEEGVVEALERLHGTPVCELPGALLAEVRLYSGGRLRDDVVILCVARKEGGPADVNL